MIMLGEESDPKAGVEVAASIEVHERMSVVDRRYRAAFIAVASLFFAWALAASLNDVLIRQFQKALALTRTESSLIQMAFYIGYFCSALPAGAMIRRFGYKATMIAGLGLYALGAFAFYPAAEMERFPVFLSALFIVAFGLAFLETAANPYVTILGHPATASARLNLALSFYGVGAILGPIIGGLFIFSGVEYTPTQIHALSPVELAAYHTTEAATVKGPYIAVGLLMCLLAVAISRTRFPVLVKHAAIRKGGSMLAAMRRPQLALAVIAIFFYVGGQVGVWSFFIDFSKAAMPSLSERTTAFLLSASLGLLMIGRFSGSYLQTRIAPRRMLAVYAAANVLLCLTAVTASGAVAVGALWLTGFFMSIMFPTIFALGIAGLGEDTEAGSSFLIMSIVGGAIIPPLMGLVADRIGGIEHAMVVPMGCFGVCFAFALVVRRWIGVPRPA
jgi:FHS family L-fucose permease-like MFS transporter